MTGFGAFKGHAPVCLKETSFLISTSNQDLQVLIYCNGTVHLKILSPLAKESKEEMCMSSNKRRYRIQYVRYIGQIN